MAAKRRRTEEDLATVAETTQREERLRSEAIIASLRSQLKSADEDVRAARDKGQDHGKERPPRRTPWKDRRPPGEDIASDKCRAYARTGSCKFRNCKFQPCKQQAIAAGTYVEYKRTPGGMCFGFAKGTCTYGAACRFSHNAPTAPGASPAGDQRISAPPPADAAGAGQRPEGI